MVPGLHVPPPYEDTADINEWLADLEDYFLGNFGTTLIKN